MCVYKYVCMHGCTYVFECTHVCMYIRIYIYITYSTYIHTYLGDREVVDSEVPEGGIDYWNAEFSTAGRGARHAHGSNHETHVGRGDHVAVLVAHEVLHLRHQRRTRGHARESGVDLRSGLSLGQRKWIIQNSELKIDSCRAIYVAPLTEQPSPSEFQWPCSNTNSGCAPTAQVQASSK